MAQSAEAMAIRYREEDGQMNYGQINRRQTELVQMDGGRTDRRPANRNQMKQRREDGERTNQRSMERSQMRSGQTDGERTDRRPAEGSQMQGRRVNGEQRNHRPTERSQMQERRVNEGQRNHRPAERSQMQERRVNGEQINHRPVQRNQAQPGRMNGEQADRRPVNRSQIQPRQVNGGQMSRQQKARSRARRKREARIRRRKQILGVMCAAVLVLIGYGLFNGLSGKEKQSGTLYKDTLENSMMDSNTSDVAVKAGTSHIVGNAADVNYTVPRVYEGSDLEAELLRLAQNSDECRRIYDNRTQYSETLLQALCSNPEMLDYVLGFLDAEKTASGGLTEEEKDAAFPLFLQWDKRWGYAVYGESYIGLSGCAPTCLAMVVNALTKQNDVTPATVAEYAQREGYYVTGTGTAWSLMTEGSSHFGVSGWEIGLSEETVMGYLQSGYPIICSMRPGDFTTQGHFIVLVGVEDGKIMVNDPNSRERSSLLWDYDTLARQIKNLWAFE